MYPLETHGFNSSAFYVVPPTTVLVDLRQSEDEILGQMKRNTRYNIRLASRKGVVVQEGNESDLPMFCQLMQVTAARSDYMPYDLAYFQEAWRQFAPQDMIKLLIAYYQGEPLAAVMVIAFGQWAVYKWGASSNAHRDKKSNNLLQWAAMRWSKERGCHYYDMGGISPACVADALKRGEKLDPAESKGAGIALFKLGFGQLATFPDAYDNNYGIRPKWLVRKATAYAGELDTLRAMLMGGTSIWKQKVAALKSRPVAQSSLKASTERGE
jgi:lipid II:glycine glycyltransferase (peptidoglycan interpeptide bridge formation enzyme)